ncbi:hypothetical protein ACFV0D_32780 [Streptomyces sp. NPDC059556]|uniref:hypothetical protein n=1 Tax=Streptomyces sp. NPDC059556 TaxID=3346863 RepID=UPI0036BC86F9
MGGTAGDGTAGGGTAGSGPEDVFADGRMAAVLTGLMRDTEASVGLVYLLIPGDRMLRLVLISGLSREIAAPWVRIPVDAPIPVADAIRERRLVWLSGLQDIAHRYPRIGIVLPYDFMLAAAPIADDTTVWGGVVLLWPVAPTPQTPARRPGERPSPPPRAGRRARRGPDPAHPPPPALSRPGPPAAPPTRIPRRLIPPNRSSSTPSAPPRPPRPSRRPLWTSRSGCRWGAAPWTSTDASPSSTPPPPTW